MLHISELFAARARFAFWDLLKFCDAPKSALPIQECGKEPPSSLWKVTLQKILSDSSEYSLEATSTQTCIKSARVLAETAKNKRFHFVVFFWISCIFLRSRTRTKPVYPCCFECRLGGPNAWCLAATCETQSVKRKGYWFLTAAQKPALFHTKLSPSSWRGIPNVFQQMWAFCTETNPHTLGGNGQKKHFRNFVARFGARAPIVQPSLFNFKVRGRGRCIWVL